MSRGTEHFMDETMRVINRFRDEYDITYVELIGCLECIKGTLLLEASELEDDDEPTGEEGEGSAEESEAE